MYTITREELLQMIENAQTHGERRVLKKHLQVFDGFVANCSDCHNVNECEDECEINTEEE